MIWHFLSATSTLGSGFIMKSTFKLATLSIKPGVVKCICIHICIKEMESSMKYTCFLAFLVVLSFAVVDGAGECGKSSPDSEAWKLLPCASAATDVNAQVSDRCCQQVRRIGQNPSCLCAVMLSNTAKSAGVKPEIALTIPKRCNIQDRPVGYKCGAYTLPSLKN